MNAERKPRLLFVGAFPPPERKIFGGMVSACRALIGSSFAQRLDLDLIDTTQISNPPPGLPLRLLLAARRVVRFVGRFERQRPDAVLLFMAPGASLVEKGLMGWYSRCRGVPALAFPRGGATIDSAARSPLHRRIIQWALGGSRMILCQGPAWQQFAREVCGVAVADAPIIANWTASPQLLAIGAGRNTPTVSPDGVPHLVFIGWLDAGKGVPELIEAAIALARTLDFRLSLVGEGNVSDSARQTVAAAGLGEQIRFLGWQDADAIPAILASSDIFVLPSHAEGFPNALVEAMAAGLAPIVTPVGTIPDLVRDGANGLLVPVGDAPALGRAMAALIENPGRRQVLGRAAHDYARAEFAVEAAAEKLVAVVETVMRDKQHGRP